MFKLEKINQQILSNTDKIRLPLWTSPVFEDQEFTTALDAVVFAWMQDFRWGFVVMNGWRFEAVYRTGGNGKYTRLDISV